METEKNYVQTKQKQNNRSIFSLLSFVWFPMKSTSVVVVVLLLLLSVFVVSASQGEEGSDQVDPNVGKDELSEEDIDAWEEMDDGDDEEEAKSEEDIVGCTGWEQYYSDIEKRAYFYHKESQTTTWSFPPSCTNSLADSENNIPSGWKRTYSEEFRDFYYTDVKRGTSQWSAPGPIDNKSPRRQINDRGPLLPSEKTRKLPEKQRPLLSTVHVNKFGSFSENCGKTDRPCGSIQHGLNRASERARVYVHPGWYNGPGNFFLDFQGKHVELLSAVDKEAVIDCENRGPVINPMVPSGHLQISGFRLIDCPMNKNGLSLAQSVEGAPLEFSTKVIKHENGQVTGVLEPSDGSAPLIMTQEMTEQLVGSKPKKKHRKRKP